MRADARTRAFRATNPADPAGSEDGITKGVGSVWLVTSASAGLERIDPVTNAIVARLQLPKGLFNPIYVSDSGWVASF